jgi:prepilin-type processing-associated H-X9-DG protein
MNNLKQIGLACHNYHDVNAAFPPGCDANDFSAAAYLLPYVEQANLFQQIDFKKPMTDEANTGARKTLIKMFLSDRDPLAPNHGEFGATNYLFNAGSKPDLLNNDGLFYRDSKTRIADVLDGLSNTIMTGETLRGDGGKVGADVRRQHVRLDKDALKNIADEAGVDDFKNNKNIAGDRCSSWMDGRFLQGTFTASRGLNDPKPDVNCEGFGGLSALRSLDTNFNALFADGSVRTLSPKVTLQMWKALNTRAGGEVIQLP